MIYDDRQKAKLDQVSALKEATVAAEARGEARGRIKTLQQILGIAQTDDEILAKLSIEKLEKLSRELQRKVATRK
jgi:hypothetical protein